MQRLQRNLQLLRKHQAASAAAEARTLDAEMVALRVGDFVLLTFPGELSAEIGLGLKAASPHALTFVACYTNGYIYYAPTEAQLANCCTAQEDCDCMLAAGWQATFEAKARDMLRRV